MEFVIDPHSQYDERSHGYQQDESTGGLLFMSRKMSQFRKTFRLELQTITQWLKVN